MDNFKLDIDADGIATFAFDVPGRTMNTFTSGAIRDVEAIVNEIRDNQAIKGAVIASAKASGFCAGADLEEVEERAGAPMDEATMAAMLPEVSFLSRQLRALETVGKPVAAALEGLALGGGFELALATHRRIASRAVRLGFPEVNVGLFPGAGGTQRTPRLAGARAAMELMLLARQIDAARALELALIDEVVEPGQTLDAAKAWLRAGPEAVQPWDRKGYRQPGGPYHPKGAMEFIVGAAQVQDKTFGNYPAQRNIMRSVYEGFSLPMDAALRIEARLFLETLQTPQARAMIRTLFVSRQALSRGDARPAGVAPSRPAKVAVLGAGMMGAGIAYSQAKAGIDTVLIDVSEEAAAKGKAHSQDLVAKAVKRGRMKQDDGEALLGRIAPTADYARIAGSDLVIEAVFESAELKADVTRKAEAHLAASAVFGSNTSALPITMLAKASARPANFIGIHFFSPVDRMELVEVIRGRETSDGTLAKALDYVKAIKKIPIVVNDSHGFYTSRVFGTYLGEGGELLSEGVAPAIVDNVGRMTGMPRGPLEMLDDVAIDLADKVAAARRKHLGLPDPRGGFDKLLIDMVAHGRFGRKNGKGFYDYPEGGAKRLWAGLAELAPVTVARSSPELVAAIRQRLLYRQAVETARCIEEGVLSDPRQADVGAILGWGFAPWSGGPISLIDGIGIARFVDECDALAERHGDRFAPPAMLRSMAAANERFYPAPRLPALAA